MSSHVFAPDGAPPGATPPRSSGGIGGGPLVTSCVASVLCPVCGQQLGEEARSLRCGRGHCFDLAREGYVNLLPAGHGRSGIRGDTAAMVRARQRILGHGYFEPIADRVSAHGATHLERVTTDGSAANARPAAALDAGCGTGYYIGSLWRSLSPATRKSVCCFGLDVSKDALRVAAREHRGVRFLVNDVSHRICLPDAGVDVLLDVFAPRNPAEFARVLRPGGQLIVVVPAPEHLGELRSTLPLLGIEPGKKARTVQRLRGGFRLAGEESVRYRRRIEGAHAADVLRMTPGAWHVAEEDIARSVAASAIDTLFSVTLLRFVRLAAGMEA